MEGRFKRQGRGQPEMGRLHVGRVRGEVLIELWQEETLWSAPRRAVKGGSLSSPGPNHLWHVIRSDS